MRLITTITSLIGIAAIAFVFAGHAFAGQSTTSNASSAFGGSRSEKVQVRPIERLQTSGSGHLKQVRCPVAASVTVCYVSR